MRATRPPELTGSYDATSALRRGTGPGVSVRVATTGDDANDGLTIATAVQTLARAIQIIPVDPDDPCTITLQDAGTFTAPAAMLLSNTTITSASATRVSQGNFTVAALTTVDEDEGILLQFGGSPGWTPDAFAGRHFQFSATTTTVALRNKWFAILGNTADSLFLVPDKDMTWSVAGAAQIGDDGNIVHFDAVIDIPTLALLRACAGLTIGNVQITGGTVEVASPNGVLFDRAQFANTDFLQKGGAMELDNCAFAMSGTDSTPIQLDYLSTLTVYGCAIRGHGTAGSAILARGYSSIAWRAKNALADFPVGCAFRPGFSSVIRTQPGDQAARIWLPDNPATVGGIAWNEGEGAIGGGDWPQTGGYIGDTYSFQAEAGAQVFVDAGSTVADSGGTARVSATGGSTNVGEAGDGTRIQGGSPGALGFTFA